MHITKSAPLPERPSEQLTCCEKIGSVPGNYINCVKKRHNCRITGKEKATCHGGQCDQCGGLLVDYQPLGSMPRRFSSLRPNSLSQLARLMPSLCASLSNCSFSSGEIRILNCGDCPSPLGLLSRLIVDKWPPIELVFLLLGGHLNTETLKKAKPEGARNTNGLLTTNDSESIEVAMLNHTTHPQGRDLHNLNKFTWRFITFGASERQIIHVTAWTEREARNRCPSGCVAVFAARIRLGETYAQ
ncbi:host cell division inhibitor Icd-like protein [Escherichia coli]|nr:host cell division inhibitor Icd-like protein [Escherichia coli]